MNENFSETTRRIAGEADAAILKTEKDNASEFQRVPPEHRMRVRFLMRMAYYEGRNDGAEYIAQAVSPKKEDSNAKT